MTKVFIIPESELARREVQALVGDRARSALAGVVVDSDEVNVDELRTIRKVRVIEDRPLSVSFDRSEREAVDVQRRHLTAIGAQPSPHDGNGIVVGVLDSGVTNHEELTGRITRFAEIRDDRAHVTNELRDRMGHGTHVSALIAGASCGVAPGCKLAVVNVLDSPAGEETSISKIEIGLRWLLETEFRSGQRGVDVINISFGIPGYEPALEGWIQRAVQGHRTLVAASIGRRDIHMSPGNYRLVVGVGAANNDGGILEGSPGADLDPGGGPAFRKPDLCAPGEGVHSASRDGGYVARDGTSQATAIISGVAAVLAGRDPSLRRRPDKLRRALLESTARIDDPRAGHGLIRMRS